MSDYRPKVGFALRQWDRSCDTVQKRGHWKHMCEGFRCLNTDFLAGMLKYDENILSEGIRFSPMSLIHTLYDF